MTDKKEKQIQRFSKQDRVQHWLLVLSFTLLAFTGLVQKFSGAQLSIALIGLMGGIEQTRVIHRFAAIVLMLESVYHIGVIVYGLAVRRQISKMVPVWSDVKDAWNSLLISFGRKKEEPKYDRYSFEEKFEYWAVIWGMGVMILTGFILWNPIASTNFLPGEIIPAAKSAHGNEALLAVLAIIIWHFYNVLVRHFNKSMFTGNLSRKEMKEFHPVELEELENPSDAPRELASAVAQRKRIFIPIYLVVSALLVFGIFLFVTFEQSALAVVEPGENLESVVQLTPTPISGISRNDESDVEYPFAALDEMWPFSAHTDRDANAFRHWDEDGEVPASCSTCHSELGLASFIDTGSSQAQPLSQGLTCDSCHSETTEYTLHTLVSLDFPSGANVESSESQITLCASCHMGRSSADSIRGLGGVEDADVVNEAISMVNLHAPAAAATFFGAASQSAFQYDGREYHGQLFHIEEYNTCSECHQPHEFVASVSICSECHSSVEGDQTTLSIRFGRDDFDGDGNVEEGIAFEIEGLQAALLHTIRDYAGENSGASILYEMQQFPYFFIDQDQNGVLDAGELEQDNAFSAWTPRLIKAAYNYHFTRFDAGAFAHNPDYVLQLLYDSLEDLGAEMNAFLRP